MANEHYTKYQIQPIEFITFNHLSFIEGNIIKYICRAEDKGTKNQDIGKVIHYLDLYDTYDDSSDFDMRNSNEDYFKFVNQFTTWQKVALSLAISYFDSFNPVLKTSLIDFLESQKDV